MKKFIIIIILALAPAIGLGQTVTSGSGDLGLTVNPNNPGPNSTTTLKVTSYAFSVSGANYNWTLNGKKVLSGLGKNELVFKTGNLGTQSEITVSAIYDGRLFEKKIIFYQNSADLMWETLNTYSPSFYEGKVFPATGSKVRVVATPNIYRVGKKVAADKLNYVWSVNFKKVEPSSGLGKNSIDLTANNAVSQIVDVSISDPAQPAVTIKKSVAIPTKSLEVVFYQYQPLVGPLYGQGLKSGLTTNSNETGLWAEIFNISQEDFPFLDYSWQLNSKSLPTDQTNPQQVTVTSPSASSTRSFLSLTVTNPNNIFQVARGLLTIYFGSGVQF